MKRISAFVLVVLVLSGALDFAGLAFGLFYEGFFDTVAHFLTSLALVALVAELARPLGGASFDSAGRAFLAGAILGLVGGGAWELFEVIADFFFPQIHNPLPDTALDMAFGTFGGAVGAWRTRAYPPSRADDSRRSA